MSWWTHLVSDNPMMNETWRPYSRARGSVKGRANTWVVGVLVALIYLALVSTAIQNSQLWDPSIFLYGMLTIMMLVTGVVIYGAIAGDREKKTIELVYVAPVTISQIVAAKLARALVPIAACLATFIVPAIVIGLVRMNNGQDALSSRADLGYAVLVGSVVSLATSTFVAGLAFFLSTLNRSMSGALTATVASLFVFYVGGAVLCGVIGALNRDLAEFLITYHPYVALGRTLFPAPFGSEPAMDPTLFTATIHVTLAALLVFLAWQNLGRDRKGGGKTGA